MKKISAGLIDNKAVLLYMDYPLWGFSLLGIAIITDILDGWLARKLNIVSRLGWELELIADGIVWISVTLISIKHGWLLTESLQGMVLGVPVKLLDKNAGAKKIAAVSLLIPLSVTIAVALFG